MSRRFLTPIELPGDAGAALYAVPKQQLDAAVAAHAAAANPHPDYLTQAEADALYEPVGGGGGGGGYRSGYVPSDQGATPVIQHDLGTADVAVTVQDVSGRVITLVAVETVDGTGAASDNHVRLTFTTAPTAQQYRYLILSAAPGPTVQEHTHTGQYAPSRVASQAELETALAAGGEIHVDSNVEIALTATMNVTLPTRIVGGHFTVASGPAFYVTSSDVEFAGVEIEGPGLASSYDSTQKLIHVVGTSGATLTGISVHDCRLSGSRGDNIWLEWCVGAIVANNIIRDFLYSGVMVISGVGVKVTGNEIVNAPLSTGVVNVYGIAFTDTANTLVARSRECSATGNRVHLIDWEGIDTHGGDGIVINDNVITACPRGVALVGGNETRVAMPQRCIVTGNRIDGTGMRQAVREGIILGGISGSPADALITGNLIDGYGGAAFLTDYWDRAATYIGQNRPRFVDWTNIPMDADFDANGTYPPQFCVDGKTVHLRGGAIPKSSTQRTVIGTIPNAAAWPVDLQFVGFVKGSNASAGSGMIAAYPDGRLQYVYSSGTDTWTYFLSGSYLAA